MNNLDNIQKLILLIFETQNKLESKKPLNLDFNSFGIYADSHHPVLFTLETFKTSRKCYKDKMSKWKF